MFDSYWSVNRLSVTVTTRTLYTGFVTQMTQGGLSAALWEDIPPLWPISQGRVCSYHSTGTRRLSLHSDELNAHSATALGESVFKSTPTAWPDSSCFVWALKVKVRVSRNFGNNKQWVSKCSDPKSPLSWSHIGLGFPLCSLPSSYPRTKQHGHLELKASIDINSTSFLN